MIAALTLLAGAVIAGWLVPHVLQRVDLRRHDPLPLIVAWLLSTAGVLLAAATGVLLLLLPNHGPGASLLAAAHSCWSAIQHGSPPRVEEATGLVGVALLIAFAARLVLVSVRGVRNRRQKRQENLEVLRLVARPVNGPSDILWLAHQQPLAFSMAGRPGVVVATDGLTHHLDPAVLARLHHHTHQPGGLRRTVSCGLTGALAAVLPFLAGTGLLLSIAVITCHWASDLTTFY